jgi:SEC-C motif domain protein
MSLCPCRSANTYETCCGPYIEKQQQPQTPEQLMRSRYSAYSLGKIDHIKNTMKGGALIGFNAMTAEQWAKQVTWLGLEILQAEPTTTDVGFVEFIARFLEHGQVKTIHEFSEFHREHDFWFYVSGVNKLQPLKIKNPQVARNAPCPCGSGKKFKNCHAP